MGHHVRVTESPVSHRPRSWIPALVGIVVLAIVVIGSAAVAADWASRNAEAANLVDAIERSEAAMGWTQGQLAPLLGKDGGGLADGKLTDDERATVEQAISSVAGDGGDRIAQAGLAVKQVRVLPWHRDILAAQAAYVRHNQAWQDYMGRTVADPLEVTRDQPEVNDSFMAVEPLLTDAVPTPALWNLADRVAAIFTEGAPADSPTGPTQSVLFVG